MSRDGYNNPWTQEKNDALKHYWRLGYSITEIASKLGAGFTRNSVVGKAHRLKLQSRKMPNEFKGKLASYPPRYEPDLVKKFDDEDIDEAVNALLSCKGSRRQS